MDCECSLRESPQALKMICTWTSEGISWPTIISGESYLHDSHEFGKREGDLFSPLQIIE